MAVSGLATRHSGAKILILHCLRGLTKIALAIKIRHPSTAWARKTPLGLRSLHSRVIGHPLDVQEHAAGRRRNGHQAILVQLERGRVDSCSLGTLTAKQERCAWPPAGTLRGRPAPLAEILLAASGHFLMAANRADPIKGIGGLRRRVRSTARSWAWHGMTRKRGSTSRRVPQQSWPVQGHHVFLCHRSDAWWLSSG